MTISAVSKSRVARVAETIQGTIPATPSFSNLRRTSGNLQTKKDTVVSDEVQLDRNVRAEYQTAQNPEGSYAFELSYGSFDDLLAAALCGTWSSNVLTNGVLAQSFTFEETVDNAGGNFSYSRFAGVMVDSLALSIASRASVKGTINLKGLQETLDTAILSGATYAASPTTSIMTSNQLGSLTVSGVTPNPKIKNISLNIANNLRVLDVAGSLYSQGFGMGQFDVTGTMDCYFETNVLYSQVLAHGTAALSTTIGGVANQKYTLTVPNLQFLNGARQLAGKNDDVMVSIPFRGILDPVSGASIIFTRGVA